MAISNVVDVQGDARSGEENLYGWPFIIFFERIEVNRYWESHALEPQGEGFSARDIQFEIPTSTQSTQYFRCSLGPLRLQVVGDYGEPARLVVRRSILSCVNLYLNRALGAPTRMFTEVRHVIEAQGIELCLEIDLEANAGRYDSELGVSLGWAKNPVFYLASAYDERTRDEMEALPFALFFKGQADSGKLIKLHQLQPSSSKVLEPMHFRLRSASEETGDLALHPVVEGQVGGSFPIMYPSIPVSTAGVSMLLDTRRCPGVTLTQQDLQDCPSLFIPPGLVRSGALEANGPIVTSRFGLQSDALPQVQVEGPSFGLDPIVRVINEDQTVTLRLLPGDVGGQPPNWWNRGNGRIEAKGWECTYIPTHLRASGSNGEHEPAEQSILSVETLCEYCDVQASLGSSDFTSTIVVLRGAPTAYFRGYPLDEKRVRLTLCYRSTDNEEVVVPLANTHWSGHNCLPFTDGTVEPLDGAEVYFVRAYDDRSEPLIWGMLVLPVPLIDVQTALDLGIG